MGLNADGTITYGTSGGVRTVRVPLGTPQPQAPRGTFWRGADGNVWVAGSRGVNSAGAWDANTQNYWTGLGYTLQADPNAPKATATDLVATGGGGGGGGSSFIDTSAARNATQVSIDSLGKILENKYTQADTDYNDVIAAYDKEDAANLEAYNKQVTTNEQTREDNHQQALLAAAQGQRGLYATLASIGALGGTGRVLANRAVASEANKDIAGADKTFETNASALFESRRNLETQEKKRRRDAERTRQDTRKQAEYDSNETAQKLWKEMADLWTRAGNNTEAANAMGRASGFTAKMTDATRPSIVPYAKDSLAYTPAALKGYLAGANDMSVNVASGGNAPINGSVYATTTKKREEL